MMTRIGPEAFRSERLSSGLSSMMRESRNPSTGSSRRDRLLGLSHQSPLSIESSDLYELKEEDMFEENLVGSLEENPHFLVGSSSDRLLKNIGLSAINTSASKSRKIPQAPAAYESERIHQSAPVNIPDWSKILGVDKRSSNNKENGLGLFDEELFAQKLPPHELIAREYAKSHTAFSVYEGAGRTLKGRDLSRVRNAVWQQTGFIGG